MSQDVLQKSRQFAVKFLYQCELEKIYFYSANHMNDYLQLHEVPQSSISIVKDMVKGVYDNLAQIDLLLQSLSLKWPLERMSVIDRNVLRLAVYELLYTEAPRKVVINEAIEIAKLFGADQSYRFVNGILDKVEKPTD
jgi:N utilization substance protein B